MTSKKPELIIFDLGRVLVDFDFKKVIRNLKRHSPHSEQEIRKYFETTPLWDAFERGQVSPRAFFKQMSLELNLRDLSFDKFQPFWNDIFTEMHESVAILKRLHGRYRLAMLSNVNQMHWEHVLKNHAFMALFDHPVASYAIGLRKPETAIFHKVLEISGGVKPSKAMFFDDLKEHITAARKVGIRAHQFINAKQLIIDLEGVLE